jgi:hypothetical protein
MEPLHQEQLRPQGEYLAQPLQGALGVQDLRVFSNQSQISATAFATNER